MLPDHIPKQASSSLQAVILEKISVAIGPDRDMVQEIANVLDIGVHSAYRRLRSDVYFRLDELEKLVKHFDLNFYEFLGQPDSSYVFHGANLSAGAMDFRASLHKYVQYIGGFQQMGLKHINYCGLDITPLALMSSPVMLTFQEYFWNYTLGIKHFDSSRLLSFAALDAEFENLSATFLKFLLVTPSTDILSVLCLNSLLGQIRYIRETNKFASQLDFEILHDEIESIVNWYEKQVAVGYRLTKSGEKVEPEVVFRFYNSELFFSDNNFFAQSETQDFAVVKHNLFSYMFTYHADFVSLNRELIQTAISKSQPLSATNEKARISFFNLLHNNIRQSRASY